MTQAKRWLEDLRALDALDPVSYARQAMERSKIEAVEEATKVGVAYSALCTALKLRALHRQYQRGQRHQAAK